MRVEALASRSHVSKVVSTKVYHAMLFKTQISNITVPPK